MILTALGSILLGCECSYYLWRRDERLPWCERSVYVILLATVLWLATTWALGLAHLLEHTIVTGRGVIFVAVGTIALAIRIRRSKAALSTEIDPRKALLYVGALLPLALWVWFALWRGAVIPPLSHDALSYHLPKAVLYQRAHGYDPLSTLQWMFSPRPANYEMLIADILATDGVDDRTEWLGTLFYVGFVLAAGALAQRWWRASDVATVATLLLAGSVPVLLLHSSAHKNDLMAAFFVVAAMVATGRWIATRDPASLFALMVGFAAAVGTKAHMIVIALCFAPVVAWRLLSPRADARRLFITIAAGCTSFLLLGGWVFVERLFRPGEANRAGVPAVMQPAQYGQWENLWQGPYILLAAPFSTIPDGLSVPWDKRPWFWHRYEIYFSHDGVPFALCALALPFAIALLRRARASLREPALITLAAFAAFVSLLPVKLTPLGLYSIMLPRFTLYVVPVVFAWTIAPLADAVAVLGRSLSLAILWLCAGIFVYYGIEFAVNDRFAPIGYVLWARTRPDTRIVPFDPDRAACSLDRLAGPNDKIVIQPGDSAWIYPAFGRRLTRPVEFVRGMPLAEDARWFLVDYKFSVIWSSPRLRTLGNRSNLLKGVVPAAARRSMESMRHDRRWWPVIFRPRWGEAVFVRIAR